VWWRVFDSCYICWFWVFENFPIKELPSLGIGKKIIQSQRTASSGYFKKSFKEPTHAFTKDPIKDLAVFRWLFEFFLRTMVICNNKVFDFLITIVIRLIPRMIPGEGWVQFLIPNSLRYQQVQPTEKDVGNYGKRSHHTIHALANQPGSKLVIKSQEYKFISTWEVPKRKRNILLVMN
jgi:hypothetical protein